MDVWADDVQGAVRRDEQVERAHVHGGTSMGGMVHARVRGAGSRAPWTGLVPKLRVGQVQLHGARGSWEEV